MLEPSVETPATIDELKIGDNVVLEKTVSESDVYMFSGVTGDLSPNHVNERYMKGSIYGTRIAQGALIVGFSSACAAMFALKYRFNAASAGYDRIRFVNPCLIGDTIRIEYRIARIDKERQRSHAELKATNQDGKLIMVGEHVMKYLPYNSEAPGRRPAQ